MCIILPNLLDKEVHYIQYIGAGISLIGLSILIYVNIEAWTAYAIYYSISSATYLTIWGILTMKPKQLDFIFPASINMLLSFLLFLVLIILQVNPIAEETILIYFGIFAGICIAAGGFLLLLCKDSKCLGLAVCCLLGLIQTLLDIYVIGFERDIKLIPNIIIIGGLETILISQCFKKKNSDKSI